MWNWLRPQPSYFPPTKTIPLELWIRIRKHVSEPLLFRNIQIPSSRPHCPYRIKIFEIKIQKSIHPSSSWPPCRSCMRTLPGDLPGPLRCRWRSWSPNLGRRLERRGGKPPAKNTYIRFPLDKLTITKVQIQIISGCFFKKISLREKEFAFEITASRSRRMTAITSTYT